MYAIIETGGKQIQVEVGSKIYVEKLPGYVGESVVLDKVCLLKDNAIKVGKPYVKNASVTCKIEKQGLNRKIKVFKYKNKTNERKMIGHRQPYTLLTVEAIEVK